MPKQPSTPRGNGSMFTYLQTPPKTPAPNRVVDRIGNQLLDRLMDRIVDTATKTDTQTEKSATYIQGVTTQYDSKLQYARKRMPQKKRKEWTKFTKRVEAVTSKNQGKITAVYNTSANGSTATEFGQAVSAIHLYGFRSNIPSTEIGANDIGYIINSDKQASGDNVLITSAGADPSALGEVNQVNRYATNKIQFTSAVLDYTYTNTNSASTGSHEVDVYEIAYNRVDKGNFNGITEVFSQANSTYTGLVTLGPASYGNSVNITQRGITPFEMGKALSMGNIIILNKYKKLVSPGQAFTAQLRDPRNRWANPQDYFTSQNNYKYKDWTKTILFIVKPVQFVEANPVTYKIGCTRTYKYTYEGLNDTKSYYVNQ